MNISTEDTVDPFLEKGRAGKGILLGGVKNKADEEIIKTQLKDFLIENFEEFSLKPIEKIVNIVLSEVDGVKVGEVEKIKISRFLARMLESDREVFVDNAYIIADKIYRVINGDLVN